MTEDFDKIVDDFIKKLQKFDKSKELENVFNPWKDIDKNYDVKNAPELRCNNLKKYLKDRKDAKYVLIAEAPGYQGCRFSGIPMTSERMFCKCKYEFESYCRTSDKTKLESFSELVKTCGFTEPTATIVWNVMYGLQNLKPTDFILWNAFPFHPYNTKLLSNRKPNSNELEITKNILEAFLKLVKEKQIIAVGNVAYNVLSQQMCKKVRHPSFGGKKEFEEKIQENLSRN